MRALEYSRFGGPETLRIREATVPDFAEDEVLIKVRASSINPFDTKLRTGLLRAHFDVNFPIRPGRDGCGDIVSVGRLAADLGTWVKPGQRVCFISSRTQMGAQAEFVAVRARDFVVPAPDNLSDRQCAALPLVGLSAWSALVDTAELREGMRVLIHGGSGGVGAHAIQIARHFGAEVHATCRSTNVERVEALGAAAIPYDTVDFTQAITDCDIVFDTVGGRVHNQSYSVVREGGLLVYLIAQPFEQIPQRTDVIIQQVMVAGSMRNLERVSSLAADGVLMPSVGKTFPLREFKDAYELVESGKAVGKVVLQIEGEGHEY